MVLAGEPSAKGSGPTTQVDLSGHHILIFSTKSTPVSVCMLDLKLYNGKAVRSAEEGGAVQVTGCSAGSLPNAELSIFRCHIENCMSNYGAGALMAYKARLRISECVLRKNTATQGGGAVKVYSSIAAFDYCVFQDNVAATFSSEGNTNPDGGGAIEIFYSKDVTFNRCELRGNKVGSDTGLIIPGAGGGIRLRHSTAVLTNCVLTGNAARARLVD